MHVMSRSCSPSHVIAPPTDENGTFEPLRVHTFISHSRHVDTALLSYSVRMVPHPGRRHRRFPQMNTYSGIHILELALTHFAEAYAPRTGYPSFSYCRSVLNNYILVINQSRGRLIKSSECLISVASSECLLLQPGSQDALHGWPRLDVLPDPKAPTLQALQDPFPHCLLGRRPTNASHAHRAV